jgi:hypothetical protein
MEDENPSRNSDPLFSQGRLVIFGLFLGLSTSSGSSSIAELLLPRPEAYLHFRGVTTYMNMYFVALLNEK